MYFLMKVKAIAYESYANYQKERVAIFSLICGNAFTRCCKIFKCIYSYPFCSVVCCPKFPWVLGNVFEVKTLKKNTCWLQVVSSCSVKKVEVFC